MNLPVQFEQSARTQRALRDLNANGYAILRDIVPTTSVQALAGDLADGFENTPFCDGYFYGMRTKRFGGLLKRSAHTAPFVMHPLMLAIAEAVLRPFCDCIQLNLTQALALHPGQTAQMPHRDEAMWRGPTGEIEYLVNVIWPFTPYREQNGATLLWRGSHRPENEVASAWDDAVIAEMDPGSALVFLGSTLHGAGMNTSTDVRLGMVVSYCLGWLKPYENQWLVYPPSVARNFSPELADLVGYRVHQPNLGNYEGQNPAVTLLDDVPEYLAATEDFQPAQREFMAEFVRGETSRMEARLARQ